MGLIERWSRLPLAVRLSIAGIVVVAEVAAAAVYAVHRGLGPRTYAAFSLEDFAWGDIGGAYPPGPEVSYWLLRSVADIGPSAWNGVLVMLTFAGLLALVRTLNREPSPGPMALAAGGLFVLNVYGIWAMIISADTALDNVVFVWSVAVVFSLLRAETPRTATWLAAIVLVVLTGLMRVSSWVMWLGLAGALVAAGPARRRAAVVLATVLFSVFAYAGWNRAHHGTFTLSTTAPMNLYLGHHPRYLDVHPQHDIETLDPVLAAERRRIAAELDTGDRMAIERELQAKALATIVDRPAEALLRSVLKAYWYGFSVFKVPHYTQSPLPRLDASATQLTLGRRDSRIALVHLPYGLLFVVTLWLSLAWFVNRREWAWVSCYVPFFVMGALAVVLFPDTRFRQSAELIALVPMSRYLSERWLTRRG